MVEDGPGTAVRFLEHHLQHGCLEYCLREYIGIISNVPRIHALISSSYVIQNVHIHCISYILIRIIEIK